MAENDAIAFTQLQEAIEWNKKSAEYEIHFESEHIDLDEGEEALLKGSIGATNEKDLDEKLEKSITSSTLNLMEYAII